MKLKKLMRTMVCVTVVITSLAGCGGEQKVNKDNNVQDADKTATSSEEEITLVISSYEPTEEEVFEGLEIEKKFQEIHPNVNIELEVYKDTDEYYKAMAIAATADQLPDVMYMKGTELSTYTDHLVDLTGLECLDNNLFTEQFLIDGKTLGVPTSTDYTCVFYWKDMFEEAGVTVPTTWPEFLDVTQKLQDYFKKDNPDFFALAVGAKDTWATYPFSEFMPLVEGGDGSIANTMTTMDSPFSPGEDAYESLKKVHTLFTSGVTGPDPLGVGFDQLATLFRAKQIGMNAAGTTFIQQSIDNGIDITNLGAFFLPVRDTKEEDLNIVSLPDNFLSIPQTSKHVDVAKDFINFIFEEEVYQEYIDHQKFGPTTKTAKPGMHEIITEALAVENVQVAQIGGNQDYADIIREVRFDWKELGASFFVEGFDFEAKMAELNEAWKAAREKNGIK